MADVIKDDRVEQPLTDRSTAELVKLASEQVSRLVRDELRLAQIELARKGKHAGIGVGLFGTAGFLALYGLAALFAAAALALALVLPAWLATLIVAVALLAIAGILALIGRGQMKRASPPVPAEAVDSVKEDIGTVTEAVKERGHR
jgi:Flp pilus assembly protein TadB